MTTIKLEIDGQEVVAPSGSTVLKAIQRAGIYIPTLCYHPFLEPYGGCRLCIVEIEGIRGFPTACTTPATDRMKVKTNTPQIQELRKAIFELILTEHPHACLFCDRIERCKPGDICLRNVEVTQRCSICPKNGRCELQEISRYLGLREKRFPLPYLYRNLPFQDKEPLIDRDLNLCVLCGRCVRVCQEVRVNGCLAFTYRGSQTIVGTAFGLPFKEVGCEFCGACLDICPVGAISEKSNKWFILPDKTVATICPYCGVGCQLKLEVKGGKIVRSIPDPQGINEGQACVKGRFGIAEFVHHPDRLTTPLVKKNGNLVPVSWDEALDIVARELSKYKGDEVAVFGSGKCSNEDNYIIQKFARCVLQTNNIDHCARLCHAPSMVGLLQTLGSGEMTNPISDILNANLLFVIGANTTATHPFIGMKIRQAVRLGKKLIVANPREIDLCRHADLWLRLRPGSDVALLMGMAKVIVESGLEDKEFIAQRCENYEEFLQSLKNFEPDFVSRVTGVPWEQIETAAKMYATLKPATILYAMGITQHTHGTDNVFAISNLALLTGNVGKPGAGIDPLRGHNNIQGSCDMGVLPNLFPGYQKVDNPEIRRKFETAWGYPLPEKPGLTLSEIFLAAYQRKIKAIYLMGGNFVLSHPHQRVVQGALEELEFFVVQDLFLTETAQYAHVVLPACSFAERDGTFTNTERRVQLIRKVIEPIGNSKPDWWIICQVAKRMGKKGFDFGNAEEIMKEIAQIVPIYGGISYERLNNGGIQWPCPTPDHPGTPILHTERFARGKGRFMPLEYKPLAELPDEEYPLILTTERSLYHSHTGTLTRRIKGINEIIKEERLEINPKDAETLGISQGEWVKVSSRRGEVKVKTLITEASPPGVVSLTFHFKETPTNALTNLATDPIAKIPEMKVCAVKIEKLKDE